MIIEIKQWAARAACKGKTSLFYPKAGDSKSYQAAVSICKACPVLAECRQYADEAQEKWGIWAGGNFYKRQAENEPRKADCGTVRQYRRGCRCGRCRMARNDAERKRYLRKGRAVAISAALEVDT